jgi:pimeloyl-ACP methyl ester carboxylesterase
VIPPSTSPVRNTATPEPRGERIFRGLAGSLLGWPWFDRAGLFALKRWFFPASRLWAAARAADGEADAFWAAVPMQPRPDQAPRLARALRRFEEARAAVNAIEAEWQRVFFGRQAESESYRLGVEDARRELRHAYNATRRHFRFLVGPDVPRIKLAIADPVEVEAIYGAALDDTHGLYAAPVDPIAIEASRRITVPTGTDFWLRFPSPSARLGDTVWARVHEPAGIVDPPTVIYGHGICVEFDHWRGLIDECHALVRLGFRVVRPEAPWHGRRVPPGTFGGERIVAAFPTGIIDTLTGAVQEWAVLARWARETSKGPLVLAGSSLGALTSQLVADHARAWPEALRPDAMLLITHTGDITTAISGGAIANLWTSPAEIEERGWTLDRARRFLSMLDPSPVPALPPQRIVSVLGRRDVILPYDGGRDLAERWCLPTANSFVLDRGHFSVPMALVHNPAPLLRLTEIVRGLG